MDTAVLALSLSDLPGVVMAAAGLGFVIFVHELGHFAVARMCGVKCEKFMVGFDFWGLKIARKWGDTVYGIGVFPLGGYVKMLGQDDDPSKVAEQMEASQVEGGSEFAKEIVGPDGKKRFVDRRSYQAKSVPQRMAIISAGVVMNMIFAFIFAFVAYGAGVKETAAIVSSTVPGGPAWRAGLEPGDEVVQINDRVDPVFRHLSSSVTLADLDRGVDFKFKRGGSGEVEDLKLVPEKMGGAPLIGVGGPLSLQVHTNQKLLDARALGEPLPPVQPGDKIVAVGGTPVSNYRELISRLVAQPAGPLTLTVEREAPGAEGSPAEGATPAVDTVTVEEVPARRMGLVMTMGPVAAVKQGSPADAAGIKPGDKIIAVDGRAIGAAPGIDPVALPDAFAASQDPVEVTLVRAGAAEEAEPETVTLTPEVVRWTEPSVGLGPMAIPAIGLCYAIEPLVEAVVEGSPAAESGITAGDRVKSVSLVRPGKDGKASKVVSTVEVGGEKGENWPAIVRTVRRQPEGVKFALVVSRDGKEVKAEVGTMEGEGYLADRRLPRVLMSITKVLQAASLGEQVSLAADETWSSLTQVVRVLQKLTTNQVPAQALGGPLTILQASFLTASDSFSGFLIFLTMLSANLAVLNFLPIPVLDGGHMVFLAWEGITGKPANEKLTVALHVVGLVLLLSLMIFVTKNDIVRIFF